MQEEAYNLYTYDRREVRGEGELVMLEERMMKILTVNIWWNDKQLEQIRGWNSKELLRLT